MTEGVRLLLSAKQKCHIAVKSRPKESTSFVFFWFSLRYYPPPQIHRYSLRSAECISLVARAPSTAGAVPLPPGGRLEIKALPQYVGVDALDDPSYADMKHKPYGFREAPALRARRENGKMKRAAGA